MPPNSLQLAPSATRFSSSGWVALLTALSFLTLLIHGYHPLSEDGGLYVAGVKYTLNPTLFPRYTAFVTEHLGYSIFAPALAALVRGLHLSLGWTLFAADLVSIALMFFAALQLLRRCITNEAAQLAGLALLSAWWTLPVAGTSLLLMDPYVTARSFSTPLTVLAIAYALDDWSTERKGWLCALSLIIAALFHPLMAAYAAAFVLTLRCARLQRRHAAWMLLAAIALLCAALVRMLAPAESPATVAAAISRYYWFLSQWQWFELLGVAGPLAVMALLLRKSRRYITPAAVAMLQASLFVGLAAIVVASAFCHQDARTHLVARLQPLRIFLPIYAVMALLLGATAMRALQQLQARTSHRVLSALPALVFVTLAAIFYGAQRNTYTISPHIELPGREAQNADPWVQAFLWARKNTPPDALFALDAKYVNQAGEDAQTFRAWSLRSALPDFSKDGGEAAITPSLAAQWLPAAAAQHNLSAEDDTTRDQRILPLGATWMIVNADTPTHHTCPYANAIVKVCSL